MEILRFYDIVPFDAVADNRLEYSVIAARQNNQWLCVRLKGLESWCFPGGRREKGESIEENARRELFEETGAVDFSMVRLGLYGVDHRNSEDNSRIRISWGALYGADIRTLEAVPEDFEIAERRLFDKFPLDNARFPFIMPEMMEWLERDFSRQG